MKLAYVLLGCILIGNSYSQTSKPSSYSFELGPTFKSDHIGQVGINIGISQYSKKCWLIDYIGVFDKTSFYSHTFSPKFGVYYKTDFITTSISAGLWGTYYNKPLIKTVTGQYFSYSEEIKEPFFGIPIQLKFDIFNSSRIGFGAKCAYIFSLKDVYDDQASVTIFLSINLNLKSTN